MLSLFFFPLRTAAEYVCKDAGGIDLVALTQTHLQEKLFCMGNVEKPSAV